MQCKLCDKEITEEQRPDAYEEITAWVSGPKKDGAVLRTHTGNNAHAECIQAEMAGVTPGQASLFDE